MLCHHKILQAIQNLLFCIIILIFIFCFFSLNYNNINVVNAKPTKPPKPNLEELITETNLGELTIINKKNPNKKEIKEAIKKNLIKLNPKLENMTKINIKPTLNEKNAKISAVGFRGHVFIQYQLTTTPTNLNLASTNNNANICFQSSPNASEKITTTVNQEIKPFLDNVKGYTELKKELKHIAKYIENPTSYQTLGASLPKGYILYGPPGTGKTYIVEQLTKDLKIPFVYRAAPSLITFGRGGSEKNIKSMFEEARNHQKPCIIFIDEIDAMANQRGSTIGDAGGSVRAHNSTVNQFLIELDGFKDDIKQNQYPIVVIGATNKIDLLDEAVTRPGRLEKKILVDLPNQADTQEILEFYLNKITLDPILKENDHKIKNKVLEELAQNCYRLHFSPAALKQFTNQASLLAAENEQSTVNKDNLNKALEKIRESELKKAYLPQDFTNVNFARCQKIVFTVLILFIIFAILNYCYLVYRKYQQKNQTAFFKTLPFYLKPIAFVILILLGLLALLLVYEIREQYEQKDKQYFSPGYLIDQINKNEIKKIEVFHLGDSLVRPKSIIKIVVITKNDELWHTQCDDSFYYEKFIKMDFGDKVKNIDYNEDYQSFKLRPLTIIIKPFSMITGGIGSLMWMFYILGNIKKTCKKKQAASDQKVFKSIK